MPLPAKQHVPVREQDWGRGRVTSGLALRREDGSGLLSFGDTSPHYYSEAVTESLGSQETIADVCSRA